MRCRAMGRDGGESLPARAVALFLAHLLALAPALSAQPPAPPANGGPPDALPASPSYADLLAEDIRRFEVARVHIDRSQFELEALLERHDYDPERIIRFVREEIAFEPYAGLLRGAAGTLQSRAGSALDRAVLLATLLKDAGSDARIRRGRLSLAQADLLLREVGPSKPPLPPGDLEAMKAALSRDRDVERVATGSGSDPGTAWRPPDDSSIDRAVDTLLASLSDAGIALGYDGAIDDLREEARDYFWVEHRRGATGGWEAIHSVASAAQPAFVDLEPIATYLDQIPSELQHRVRFAAFIEQKVGDELKVHRIMDPWERPAANLVGRAVTFAIIPSGLNDETLSQGWEAVLGESPLFVPLLDGAPPPGARAFDRNGIPFSLEAQGLDSFGATALIQEVGGKFESAAGLLQGLDRQGPQLPPEDTMALVAAWVEYTVIAPGGAERTYRRSLVDRLGADRRATGAASPLAAEGELVRLVGQHTFQIATGGQSPAELLDAALAEASRRAERWRDLDAESRPRGELAGSGGDRRAVEGKEESTPHRYLFGMFDRASRDPGLLLYRAAPQVVSLQSSVEGDDTVSFHGDVVHSVWRAFSFDGSRLAAAPAALVRQGVWETATEAYLLELLGERAAAGPGRTELDRGGPAGAAIPLVIASRPDLDGAVGAVMPRSLDAEARYHLGADLGRGYVAVLSSTQSLSALNPTSIWWRLDPRTGETLGIGAGGRGAVITAYTVTLGVTLGAMAAVVTYCAGFDCLAWRKCAQAAPLSRRCCLQRYHRERRAASQQSLPGSLLVAWGDVLLQLMDYRYDPRCF